MDTQDMLGVLLGMTEQQQKAIAEAVEELKKQTASLDGAVPELQKAVQAAVVASMARSMGDVAKEAQAAVRSSVDPVLESLGGIVAAANQAEAKLNRAAANFGWRWLLFAGACAAGAAMVLLASVYMVVWWERSELAGLQAEKAAMEESIARLDAPQGACQAVRLRRGQAPVRGSRHRHGLRDR